MLLLDGAHGIVATEPGMPLWPICGQICPMSGASRVLASHVTRQGTGLILTRRTVSRWVHVVCSAPNLTARTVPNGPRLHSGRRSALYGGHWSSRWVLHAAAHSPRQPGVGSGR